MDKSKVTLSCDTAAVELTVPLYCNDPVPRATNPLVPKLQLLFARSA